MRWWIKW